MKNSKTYLRSCRKCKNTFEAKTRRSPYCNECKSCKSCGKEISAKSKSGYCASCKPALSPSERFYNSTEGFTLARMLMRYGTYEALPRDLDNLRELFQLIQTQRDLQHITHGKYSRDSCFNLCHLTPKSISDGVSPLWTYNLIIGPASVNQKLGATDYGYNFIIPASQLSPAWEFPEELTEKEVIEGLYRYWPEVKAWVDEQNFQRRPQKVNTSFNRTRGDYHRVLISEIKRLVASGKHGANLPLFRKLLEHLSKVSWDDFKEVDAGDFVFWGCVTEKDLDPAIQYLAETVCQALLTKDITCIEFAVPSDPDRYRSSSYSWFEEEKIINEGEW